MLVRDKMVLFYLHFSHIILYICYHGLFLAALQVTGSHVAEAVVTVHETDKEGKIMLNETESTNCTVMSVKPAQNEEYVSFNDQNSLVILKPLDLEVLLFQGNSSTLIVQYVCDGYQKTVSLDIIPVNEFSPIFINSPYTRSINEGSANGSEVINLGDKWQDYDKVKYNMVSAYRLHSYIIGAFDGKAYFRLDENTGNLTTAAVFDYENTRNYFLLNISVEDDGGKTSFSTVNVTILDVDDNPPVFTRCVNDISDHCHVTEYSATVDRFFQGTLSVSPKSIYAKDKDTGINARILYEIESVDEMTANIQIDNHTGEVEVIVPFTNLTNWTHTEILNISLQVKATEESINSHQTNITLTVFVYRELPTTTFASTTTISPSLTLNTSHVQPTKQPTSRIDTLLLIEIIVPVCAAIALAIIVVCVLWKRKQKQKDTRYKVRESQRVENGRKSENFERKNIDVISSTPINPYELISVYARMDSSDKNEDSPNSNKTENTEGSGEDRRENDENQAEDNNAETTGEELEERLYAKVDKRKQRKRPKQDMVFMNHATGITEAINEKEYDDSDNGTQVNHISDAIESPMTSSTDNESNGEQQVYEIPETGHVSDTSSEPPVTSPSEPDTYRLYDNMEPY